MAKLEGVKTLDMVNGEITKVAYGGAAYERVEGEAQIGDLVLITDHSWVDATKGSFYMSVDISKGDPRIIDDINEHDSNFNGSYNLFRKVAAASVESEPKPERWKVGDYAKVVNATDYHRFSDGDIVEILEDSFTHENNEVARRITDEEIQYVFAKELVRATDEEVAEAKRAAAERKKWAEIGREIGEYKVGDIVRVIDTGCSNLSVGDIGPISEIDESCAQVSARNLTEVNWVSFKRIELITPVEARFDR